MHMAISMSISISISTNLLGNSPKACGAHGDGDRDGMDDEMGRGFRESVQGKK
jgi:hypothetical protein